MSKFEIHITGDEKINDVLTVLGIKNIIVDLYSPDMKLLKTEYMSSFVKEYESFEECYKRVYELVRVLVLQGIAIYRIKIESPYCKQYLNNALYIESHFRSENNQYPISINRKSKKVIGTDRTYNKAEYPKFKEKWKDAEVELCLFDTNSKQDDKWLKLYNI